MDFGATISRAFNIVSKNRALWVLGFLAALAGGGGSSFNFNSPGGRFGGGTGSPSANVDPQMQRFLNLLQQNSNAIFAGLFGLVCVLFIIGIVLRVIGIIADGGLIGSVDQIERDGSTTFSQAWQVGLRKFAPLFGLNFLIGIPTLIVVVLAFVLMGGALIPIFASAAAQERNDAALNGLAGAGIGVLCIGSALLCVASIYSLLASAVQTFGERAIVLDNQGVMDSIRKGWEIFRANLGNIILLAIVMLVISWVIGLVVGLVSAALLVPVLVTGVIGAANNSDGFNIGVGTIALAAIAFVAVSIIAAIISALFRAFNSTAWTLAYRQFTGKGLTTESASTPPTPLPTA